MKVHAGRDDSKFFSLVQPEIHLDLSSKTIIQFHERKKALTLLRE